MISKEKTLISFEIKKSDLEIMDNARKYLDISRSNFIRLVMKKRSLEVLKNAEQPI